MLKVKNSPDIFTKEIIENIDTTLELIILWNSNIIINQAILLTILKNS